MQSASRVRSLAIALTAIAVLAAAPQAGEITTSTRSDPCIFYRTQAFGRGLDHFAAEMLWACEAIETRRAAMIPLSERMQAMAGALERYRDALIAATRDSYRRDRETALFGLSETEKRALAERTGTLAALDAIRTGY